MRRTASKMQRVLLWSAQKGLCSMCGRNLPDDFEVDHIIPFSKKGKTQLCNLQALCGPCHLAKTCGKASVA
jgi:5-methylcytosine-specific restriction protein A